MFDLDDFSNYRSSNYMNSTVFSLELIKFFRTSYYCSFTEKYDILPRNTNCYAPLKKCFCLFESRRSCKISKNFSYFLNTSLRPKKSNTLVSRNTGDEKSLHPGSRKTKLFINLIEFFK